MRTHKLAEADLILVLLTKDHGLIRGVAKGIRKTKSHFGARLDRFSKVDINVYPGRTLAKITDAATIATYASPIVGDPDRYFAGTAMLEMAQLFAAGDGGGGSFFHFLDANLRALTHIEDMGLFPVTLADRFVLQCLGNSGWMPSLVDCAQCGKPGPHRAFNSAAGGAVCVHCRPTGSATPPAQAVRLLWLLVNGRLAQAADAGSDVNVTREAHRLLAGYVRTQLETACPAFSNLA